MNLSDISIKTSGRGVTIIDQDNVSMSDALSIMNMIRNEKTGLINPIPFNEIKDVSRDTLNIVMQALALYTFPTTEVIEFLKNEIDDGDPEFAPDAIEICAGSGWIGRNLDIPMTDSYLQQRKDINELYKSNNVVPIEYPSDVERADAITAIKKYQPEFVIGSYVTRKWGLGSKKEGNMYGVDTGWVVNNCHKFYLIGNKNVHGGDPIMKRNHTTWKEEWLVTRGNSDYARIWMWENKQWH